MPAHSYLLHTYNSLVCHPFLPHALNVYLVYAHIKDMHYEG